MNFEVRLAKQGDEGPIHHLLMEMHAENGMFSLHPALLRQAIANTMVGGMCFVATVEKRLVGSIGLYRTHAWYSLDDYVTDRWTYVHPDYRKSGIAKALVEAAKKASHWPLYLGLQTPVRFEAKERFFKSLGFEKVGVLFKEGR